MATARATHAVVANFDMDASRRDEQEEGLRNRIAPGVRSTPGVVHGYWTRSRDDTRSTVMVLFESARAAAAFAESVQANAAGQQSVGIVLRDVDVRVITAEV
ncbi:MAG: hypothetical protein JO054_08515 [Actinobacteria bacterium]|nr:hypothetical protein [Actinomycetota bacterium]MBV9254258.1 hypothetical protein [Actinomycetota bacterium]